MQVNINELTQTIVDTKELQELKRIAKAFDNMQQTFQQGLIKFRPDKAIMNQLIYLPALHHYNADKELILSNAKLKMARDFADKALEEGKIKFDIEPYRNEIDAGKIRATVAIISTDELKQLYSYLETLERALHWRDNHEC